MNNANIGYQFNRVYFEDLQLTQKEGNETHLKKYIEDFLIKRKWNTSDKQILLEIEESKLAERGFKLKTTYPGLLVGAGMEHEINTKGELKLGFYFDHSTGMPVIPGSSVKGAIRSAFPQWMKHKKTPPEIKKIKTIFIESLISGKKMEELEYLKKNKEQFNAVSSKIQAIEYEIFEGVLNDKPLSIYNRDVFLDAVIVQASRYEMTQGEILGTDSITPHIHDGFSYEQSMLKDPVPLPFIKVLPGVVFLFQFDLKSRHGQILSLAERINLFQKILLTLGIGAKTNVGYGQFEPAS